MHVLVLTFFCSIKYIYRYTKKKLIITINFRLTASESQDKQGLEVSVDGAWQKRGSGRCYNSLSGKHIKCKLLYFKSSTKSYIS